MGAVGNFRWEIRDLKVDVFGATAVATFVLDYSVEVGGSVYPGTSRSTMVLAKDGSTWKFVHEHRSVLR